MRVPALLLALLVSMLTPVTGALARDFPPATPFDRIALSQIGYANNTLRGPVVSADYFIPGPEPFRLGEGTLLELEVLPSELLTSGSVMNVRWNDVSIHDRQIGGSQGGAIRMTIAIPRGLIEPEVNRLEVRAQLRLDNDTCEAGSVDSPARHLTVMASSAIRYGYADPRVRWEFPVVPDLVRYPEPFFLPTYPQPAPVRFVIPAEPSSTELTALLRVSSQLGQYAGDRGVKIELQRANEVTLEGLEDADRHLVVIGKRSSLPFLADLELPLRERGGTFEDTSGQAVPRESGVVMLSTAPWNYARGVLAITGESDAAVERAALAVSGRDGIRALRGKVEIIGEASPVDTTLQGTDVVTLAELGRVDDEVSGVGDHGISFTTFLPAVHRDSSVAFDAVISHSALLDRNRSSLRLIVNDLPLESVALRDIDPVHAVRRFDLPGAALRPGANSIRIEVSLRLPGFAERDLCNAVPVEQAWAVLHSDSGFHQPADTAADRDLNLSLYPYPFHRAGRLDETVVVVPAGQYGNAQALVQLTADLGRGTRADLLHPVALDAASFDPARDAVDRDIVLFGLPEDQPLLAALGDRLPVGVGPDQRLVLAREITVRVADREDLGVVQLISSPWSPGRAVLVVTGTSALGLDYAVEAIRRRSLSGNVVLASERSQRASDADSQPLPDPIVFGGPPDLPIDVTSFQLRPPVLAPGEEPRPPYALIAVFVVLLLALALAVAQSYQASRTDGSRS